MTLYVFGVSNRLYARYSFNVIGKCHFQTAIRIDYFIPHQTIHAAYIVLDFDYFLDRIQNALNDLEF